jgi:large subunit ribosomal protein L31
MLLIKDLRLVGGTPEIQNTLCKSFLVPYFCNPLSTNCMKKSIHPEYKEVVFWDTSSDFKFLSRSTSVPKETIKWTDGKDYPVIKVEVSSASHPFFTGKKMFVDTAGRVEKFKNKYKKS